MNDLRKWLRLIEGADLSHWFAGSKIVDKQNKPLIVYHGTPHEFSEYDFSRGRSPVAFFTDSALAASGYGIAKKFYLRITNPAIFDFKGKYWNDYNRPKGDYAIYRNGVMVKSKGFFDSEFEAEYELDDGENISYAPEGETTNSLAEAAKQSGHDGCIFRRVRDNSDTIDFDEPHTVYAVFSGDQIRSTTT